MTVWDIHDSFYLPIDDIKGVPLIQHLPRLKLAQHDAAMNTVSLLSPPSQWVSPGCRLPFFGLCHEVRGFAPNMHCYTFEPIGPPHNSQLQRFDPLLTGFTDSLDSSITDSEDYLRDLRFCDQYLVTAWLDDDSYVTISLIHTPVGPRQDVDSKTEYLHFNTEDSEYIVVSDFDFCPASGRLVVATESRDIRIMDYLSPLAVSGSPRQRQLFSVFAPYLTLVL